MEAKPKVLITGISGYIGSHVCLAFLKDAAYTVRGTLRDPSNEEKLAPLRKAAGDILFESLELASVDLMDPE